MAKNVAWSYLAQHSRNMANKKTNWATKKHSGWPHVWLCPKFLVIIITWNNFQKAGEQNEH